MDNSPLLISTLLKQVRQSELAVKTDILFISAIKCLLM